MKIEKDEALFTKGQANRTCSKAKHTPQLTTSRRPVANESIVRQQEGFEYVVRMNV